MKTKKIGGKTVRVIHGDLTLLDVESFVFYANRDLKLGTGYGNMVAQRGGPKIQEALNDVGTLEVGQAVATTAGKLNADYIIHAVGPAFSEKDTARKLKDAVVNALDAAKEKNVKSIAFPPMGTGFYGIEPATSAKIMAEAICGFVHKSSSIEEITICVRDAWETAPFEAALSAVFKTEESS